MSTWTELCKRRTLKVGPLPMLIHYDEFDKIRAVVEGAKFYIDGGERYPLEKALKDLGAIDEAE